MMTEINRLKQIISNRIDKKIRNIDLSLLLKRNRTFLATCKNREIIPYKDIINYCLDNNIDLNDVFKKETK